jgi:hypothetical protein
MNWPIYLTTIGAILAGAGFLHQLLLKRKEATIETLTEKNKWLQEQLNEAKQHSPDALVERLSKRVSIQEAEIERLSKDYQNEVLIKAKEEELEKTRELQAELEREIERHLKEYSELEDKVDVCPSCQSELTELTYIDAEEDSGQLRSYACGYSEIDGYPRYLCPSDPDYPDITDFEFIIKHSAIGWTCVTRGKTKEARRLPNVIIGGKTEEEARNNAITAFKQRTHKANLT